MEIYKPGTMIADRYEVMSKPLMGGMGIVYYCRDDKNDRLVALKTFQSKFLPDRSARDSFFQEGTIWVELDEHPNIVRCYEVTFPGLGLDVFLVLELVKAEQWQKDASLRSYISPRQPLPLRQALGFAIQMAWGMQHATKKIPNLVHRDLKPENILVGVDKLPDWDMNRVRVTDFGLSKVVETSVVSETPKENITKQIALYRQPTMGPVGTPLYMAPEQWIGGRVNASTDIYAFGCILIEMITGSPALQGKSISELKKAHCQGELLPLPEDLSPELREFLHQCVTIQPEKRYGDWTTLVTALIKIYKSIFDQNVPLLSTSNKGSSKTEQIAKGWSYFNLGASYYDINKYDTAEKYYDSSLKIGQKNGAKELEARALGGLASIYSVQLSFHEAISYWEKSLEVAKDIGNRLIEANNLYGLGNAYRNLGDLQKAFYFLNDALNIARRTKQLPLEGMILGKIGLTYANKGDLEKSVELFKSSLQIAFQVYNLYEAAVGFGNLGTAYEKLGDLSQAEEYIVSGLEIARQIGDRQQEGGNLGNLGYVYLRQGKSTLAINYLEQSLVVAREIGDYEGEQYALSNLAEAQWRLRFQRR